MEWNSTETIIIEREAGCCQDGSDLQQLLLEYEASYFDWQEYINRIVTESGLSYPQLAKRCRISKNTLRSWCLQGGRPRSRETLIKLGFGLDMTLSEVNRLLFYGGRFHRLYPKDLQDAACIFVLLQRQRYGGDRSFDYDMAMQLFCEAAQYRLPEKQASVPQVEKRAQSDAEEETQTAMERLLSLQTQQEFQEFIAEVSSGIAVSHKRLLEYLSDFIGMRLLELARQEGKPVSWHQLASMWDASGEFEKMISSLKHRGIVPKRRHLIALGLRLEMTMPEMNTMLGYAGMEGLYARDKLECVLIYALQNLELLHPEVRLGNALQLMQITKNKEIRTQCSQIVEEYMERCYQGENGDWTEVAEYVCRILEELKLPEAEEMLTLLQ